MITEVLLALQVGSEFKKAYRISANSFRGNYSFLKVENI
jgi:hypothetical protein